MKTAFIPIYFFLLLSCLSAQTARVQQYNETQRREQVRSIAEKSESAIESESTTAAAPEVTPGETEDTGPQYMLHIKPRKTWIEAGVDTQYYYTSNIFLAEEPNGVEADDTGLLVSTASVAFAPEEIQGLGGTWSPKVGFRHQWYNYGLDQTKNQYNNLDFDAQTVFAETRYTFYNDWTATAGFDWTRLLAHEPPVSDYSEFYKEYVPRWGLERRFLITDQSMFAIGYNGSFHYTNVDPNPRTIINDRHEQSMTLSFTQQITEGFYVQPFYRFLYTGYDVQLDPVYGNSRKDYLHTGGLTLMYFFNNWASVRTFFTYDHKESDDVSIPDYSKWDAGVGGALSIRF